jgi:hypothetical protein
MQIPSATDRSHLKSLRSLPHSEIMRTDSLVLSARPVSSVRQIRVRRLIDQLQVLTLERPRIADDALDHLETVLEPFA